MFRLNKKQIGWLLAKIGLFEMLPNVNKWEFLWDLGVFPDCDLWPLKPKIESFEADRDWQKKKSSC